MGESRLMDGHADVLMGVVRPIALDLLWRCWVERRKSLKGGTHV
jgi:hypothetical protein